MFEIYFGNYFLTVYNEGDDHFSLYFVYFLSYPPMYEEIDCSISSYRHPNNLNSTLSSLCCVPNLCELHDLFFLFESTIVKDEKKNNIS